MMRGFLTKLITRAASGSAPAVPAGERVYAVGDIHGRLDLFAAITQTIESDNARREPAKTTVILLGDLIDRGPDSAAVLMGARAWQSYRTVRILLGNHEELFLKSFTDQNALREFWRVGGRETLHSYGIDVEALHAADAAEAQVLMHDGVPSADLAFIRKFEDYVIFGDYLFVHAGIRPGIAAAQQHPSDLRWIREPFLSHRATHSHVVVHGHTVTVEPVIKGNRIGIDTGAYKSGRLTALGFAGKARWLLEARELGGEITVTTRLI